MLYRVDSLLVRTLGAMLMLVLDKVYKEISFLYLILFGLQHTGRQ